MEIYISNLDSSLTRDDFKVSLVPILLHHQIQVFDVRKAVGKTFATLTIADLLKAERLLTQSRQNPSLFSSPSGRQAKLQVSRKQVDRHLVRVLLKDEKDLQNVKVWQKSAKLAAEVEAAEGCAGLKISTLQCGRWETWTGKTVFVPYFELSTAGQLMRDGRALVVRLEPKPHQRYDLVMDLSNIQAFAISSGELGNETSPSQLMITSTLAPKIYEHSTPTAAISGGPMAGLRAALMVGITKQQYRDCTLPGLDAAIVGSCLTYSIMFSSAPNDLAEHIMSMMSHRFDITKLSSSSVSQPKNAYDLQSLSLNAQIATMGCSAGWWFQIHGLWANGYFSPAEVQLLLPAMNDLRARSGETTLLTVLRTLNLQLPYVDATTDLQEGGMRRAWNALSGEISLLLQDSSPLSTRPDQVTVFRATVTPTGVYLYGPELIASNRILRQYRAHTDCFLRVLFSDEDETRIDFDRDVSNERVFRGRFLSILRKGLDVGGGHFDFLGFSHSSLRMQTCWFMRPFIQDGTLLFAKDLIRKLGDFSKIRSPAKCAARIGQAFSDTTNAVSVDPTCVSVDPDVKAGRFTFTDGCGTISKSIWKSLKGNVASKDQPTSYQIRYKGAKGMLTLDERLQGDQIRLRQSMVKFEGSPSDEIEICGSNRRPIPFKLNRQIIKILEDRRIPDSVFEKLQEQDIQRLRLCASSRSASFDFIVRHLSDVGTGLPTLLKHLEHIGVDATEDGFLREILGALLQIQLREIKYRTRILVPDAVTLYGISDETGWLKEGQIFVTFIAEGTKKHSCLNGRVAVTRSPALHPGDIQIVEAVEPPDESPLWCLRNCVIFSQQGARDLPSMLSGGDLDGDLYNIIYDEALIPEKRVEPAAYQPPTPLDIARSVTVDDMVQFFVEFMENDQLGRIATLHQVFADMNNTFSDTCLLLAELHSTAVDFSKSGIAVDIGRIPRAPRYRPDFMAPSASTKVEKGIKRPAEQFALPAAGGKRYQYYESEKILGRLYRAVDEDTFFQDLEDDKSSLFNKNANDNVLKDIRDWVVAWVGISKMKPYEETARQIKNYYESNMLDIMANYGINRNEHVTEKEVFIGKIMGRTTTMSKLQREQSDYMKTRFARDLQDIRSWMESRTSDDDDKYGFINLAAACLDVAVEEPCKFNTKLSSFGWFVATLCVPEIVKAQESSVLRGCTMA